MVILNDPTKQLDAQFPTNQQHVSYLPGQYVPEQLKGGPELTVEEQGVGRGGGLHLALAVHRDVPEYSSSTITNKTIQYDQGVRIRIRLAADY